MKYNFECNPVVAWLNVNQACNMRCKWCYAENSHYDTDKQMSTGLAKELVDISLDFGVKEFVLIGGEPTLWSGFFEILKYIKENGAKISVITNGMRFSEDKFWENYKKNPATSIGLSVKAATKEMFNVATGIDQYEKSMVGIRRIIQFHQCGVSAVHNKLVGIDGIVDIAKKCREFGATSFQLIMCSPSLVEDNICTDFVFLPEKAWGEIETISKNLEEIYDETNVYYDTQLPLCLFPKEFVLRKIQKKKIQTQCHIFTRSGINFDTYGNVIVCNTIPEIIATKGIDFTDAKSLERYLNDEECRLKYRDLSRYPSIVCDDCIWKDDCRGGCLMNWLIYEPETICHAIY